MLTWIAFYIYEFHTTLIIFKMITSNLEQVKSLALQLFEINAFKFGDFKMKIGINSPVYFDLRIIISYPEVMVNN